MRVAICDDEAYFRRQLKELLLEFNNKENVFGDIIEFDSGESLIHSEKTFNIIFLDCQMPKLDGLSTAKYLRSRNINCCIIFLTSYPHYVFDSFEVRPFRFMLKPVDPIQLQKVLNDYIEIQRKLSSIIIVDRGELINIRARDVVYVEADGKYSIVRTLNDHYRSSKTVSEIENMLPNHMFYRTHRAYLINMLCISSFDHKYAILYNGEKALISHKKYNAFKKEYKEFIKKHFIDL